MSITITNKVRPYVEGIHLGEIPLGQVFLGRLRSCDSIEAWCRAIPGGPVACDRRDVFLCRLSDMMVTRMSLEDFISYYRPIRAEVVLT